MKKNIKFSTISSTVLSIILILFGKEISAQTNFTHVTDHPVFSYGASGEWDDGTVWNPAVIKDGDTLRMWYTGFDCSVWESPKGKIGYAWSLDGIEWHRFAGNPVLSGELSWEASSLYGCAMIKDGDTFKMWYGAGGFPSSTKVGYATSEDGKTWSKHPDPVLQVGPSPNWDYSMIVPHTVVKEDSIYKMWYWGGKPGFPFESSVPQTGLATSADGINWVKYDDPSTTVPPFSSSDPVLKVGNTGEWDELRAIEPMVLPTHSGYEMWYLGVKPPIDTAGIQKIGYATSTDGITWTKWPTNPIIGTNPVWGYAYYGGTVLKFNEKYHLWYACFHSTVKDARPQIGYATSPITVGVESPENERELPTQFRLFQNYPNPFNPETIIQFSLPNFSLIEVSIYNLLGQRVRQLVNQSCTPGEHFVKWNGKDDLGSNVPSGIYLYKIKTVEFTATRKMILCR